MCCGEQNVDSQLGSFICPMVIHESSLGCVLC